MKTRLLSFVLVMLLLAGLLPLSASAAMTPAESNNRYDDASVYSYNRSGAPVRSHLYDTGNGFGRVEYIRDYSANTERIVVETYTYDGRLLTQQEIPMELTLYGGVFIGSEHNYLVFGAENNEKLDEAEVVRVVKYSKAWKRLGSVSLRGANTQWPFYFGSVRMTEDARLLYVHTSHQMYIGHQANLTFAVDKAQLRVTDVRSAVLSESYGYVSHSLDQFVTLDSAGRLVTLDLGDAHPRAVTLYQHQKADDSGVFLPYGGGVNPHIPGNRVELLQIPGQSGSDLTGVTLAGLGASPTHYFAVGICSEPGNADSNARSKGQRNVFVCAVPNGNLSADAVKTIWLTSYDWSASKPTNMSPPQFLMLRDGRSLVLWMMGDTVCYQYLDSRGEPQGKVRSGKGALSDCAPVEIGGAVYWYVTTGSGPVFYKIDAGGTLSTVSAEQTQPTPSDGNPFKDVKAGAYYYEPVLWAVKHSPQITNGTSADAFSPDAVCTRGQVVTFLWRAAGCPAPKSRTTRFVDAAKGTYYYDAVLWAVEQGITNGTDAAHFSPDAFCTRAHAATFLWRAQGSPSTSGSTSFADVPNGQYYSNAVVWAVKKGVTNGTDATHFSPDAFCTRAQIVTFLYRAMG